MIYSALAAVVCAALAWDFGRRWLSASGVNDVHRSRLDEMCADIARIDDETSERLDDLRGKYGDLGTAHNLRVRAMQEKIDALQEQMSAASKELQGAADDIEASDARICERIRAIEATLERDIGHLSGKQCEQHDAIRAIDKQLADLADKSAEPPDVAKFNRAMENLVREMREEFAKRATHEDLKTAETRLHGVLSGSVAKGAKRFA